MTEDPTPPPPPVVDEPKPARGSLWVIVVAVLVALALIYTAIRISQTGREKPDPNESAMQSVRSYMENLNTRNQERLADGSVGDDPQMEQDLQQFSSQIRDASENMTGDEAIIARATAEFVENLHGHLAEYNAAIAALEESQGVNAETLQSVAEIQARREVVLSFREANASFAEFYRESPHLYRNELEESDLKSGTIAEQVSSFMTVFGPRREILLDLRANDNVLAQQLLKILSLFENQWGQWAFDEEAGQVNFENQSFQQAYAEAFEDLSEVTRRQRELQEKLLQTQADPDATAPTAPAVAGD